MESLWLHYSKKYKIMIKKKNNRNWQKQTHVPIDHVKNLREIIKCARDRKINMLATSCMKKNFYLRIRI